MKAVWSLGCALALCASSASQAQDAIPTYTPEQDLRCAAVVTIVAANAPAEHRVGMAAGMSYFIGRWETASGKRFEDALTPDYVVETAKDLAKYQKECGQRLSAYGLRLQDFGQRLIEAGKKAK